MSEVLSVGVVLAVTVALGFWLTVGLAGLAERFFRWRRNRYARKMGYPTLLDVWKKMERRKPHG